MSKVVKFNFSDSSEIPLLDSKLKNAYEQNSKVRFVFDLTNLNVSDAGNIPKIINLVEKYKNQEHKLECIDIVCPKSHTLKRNLIKKCIKMAKIGKPVYLVEKA
tara:strand:+ start:113 stop:424 length:312 start_codon:yes stop_codon:yes gene_type:complete